MKKFLAPLAFLSMLAPHHAGAAPVFEDLDAIDELTALMASSVGREALPVDRRIKLARCPEAVAIDFADRDSLAVRCKSINWRLRVPLAASRSDATLHGAATQRAALTAPAIRRGDNVSLEIRTETFTVSYAATAIDDAAVGQQVRLRTGDNRWPIRAIAVAPGRARMDD
jgi:flagellar basal body P-ring formation protein FlgA